MKEILSSYSVKYRKIEAEKDLMEKYKIKKLPALLFFKKGKLLGKVEGYYDNNKKEALLKKIKTIIG
jgi:thioredoxin-related protein